MFNTLFYIVILGFQSIFAESNFEYNQQIRSVNQLIIQNEYSAALQKIRIIERRSIFTNNDVSRMHRSLALKLKDVFLDKYFKPKLIDDFAVKSFILYKKKDFVNALLFSRLSLQSNAASDSLTKVYELIAEKSPRNTNMFQSAQQKRSVKNLRMNEAMNLLDLMKLKEKTLF